MSGFSAQFCIMWDVTGERVLEIARHDGLPAGVSGSAAGDKHGDYHAHCEFQELHTFEALLFVLYNVGTSCSSIWGTSPERIRRMEYVSALLSTMLLHTPVVSCHDQCNKRDGMHCCRCCCDHACVPTAPSVLSRRRSILARRIKLQHGEIDTSVILGRRKKKLARLWGSF